MAFITNKNSKKHREYGLIDNEEAPEPDVSAQNELLKTLLKKQTSGNTSLSEQLNTHQSFVVGSHDNLSTDKFPSGTSSLASFTSNSKQLNLHDFLVDKGLNENDINFFNDLRNGRDYLKEKYNKVDPDALEKRIKYIFGRIKSFETSSCPSQNCSSHPPSNSPNDTKLLSNSDDIRGPETNRIYPPNHPINQLADIEKSLFGHLRKKEELLITEERAKVGISTKRKSTVEEKNELICYLSPGTSQWDQKKMKKYDLNTPKVETVVKTCSPQTWYTIRDGKTAFLGRNSLTLSKVQEKPKIKDNISSGVKFVAPSHSQLIPMSDIQSNKLSLEEIKKMPKFESYSRGIPSATLFIKNLASSVVESDLVKIFGNFEEKGSPAIVYRLMGGRMKGQAFVSFSGVSTAENALESVNGYILHEKPIIIQFGNKS